MPPKIPVATYRIQLTKQFGFDAAAALVPYLKRLGISHLYASPFLAARAGSTHGYDIVDHNRLNPELGGEEAFERLSRGLVDWGMGLILDFVPNHMGIGFSDNLWWLDVLEWGQKSPHALSFDIDWYGLPHRTQPGVLLPILGRPYGDVLAEGEIALKFDAVTGSFAAWYFDHKLPINPQRYGEILRTIVGAANAHDLPAGQAMVTLAHKHQGPHSPSYEDAPGFKRDLAAIEGAADVIERGLHAYCAKHDAGRLLLHRLLERQSYHLAYWRVAFSAINYRRFFDINDLAGLRPEHPGTFKKMHGLVARLIAEGKLHGLRLDHIDGLRDPAQYIRRLHDLIRGTGATSRGEHFYILIEKILGDRERLPDFTGVAGTTGYERLNHISHVLLDDRGLDRLEQTWRDLSAERSRFEEILKEAKRNVLDTMLASEFTVLTRALSRIAAGSFATRDFTQDRLRAALQAYVLEFPVYRTYISAVGTPSAQDRSMIADVIARARARWRGPDPEIFDFLHQAITTDLLDNSSYSRPRARNFAMKLQQFTGPLMAKSLEDTTFYRYNRLLALNEVGGEPAAPDASLQIYHRRQQEAAEKQPHALIATATHDTKRGEDARMRILALSELSEDWGSAVRRWSEMNAPLVRDGKNGRQPSAAHEYMLYQTLIGIWPFVAPDDDFVKRMEGYAIKAAREGKQQTSWTNPDAEYEEALIAFLRAILSRNRSAAFISDFEQFARRTALLGALNSLSQLALKVFSPGVPDFFQGTEFFDLTLVDPDNRRPVDYDLRRREASVEPDWPRLIEGWTDGRIKFAATLTFLKIRNEHAALFRDGTYEPLMVHGAHADHVIGFSRALKGRRISVLAGRHFGALTDGGRSWPQDWNGRVDLSQDRTWRDLIHGRTLENPVDLQPLLDRLPVAVLAGDRKASPAK